MGKTAVYLHPYRYQLSSLVADLASLVSLLEIRSFLCIRLLDGRSSSTAGLEQPRGSKDSFKKGGTAGIADDRQQRNHRKADRNLLYVLLREPLIDFVDD